MLFGRRGTPSSQKAPKRAPVGNEIHVHIHHFDGPTGLTPPENVTYNYTGGPGVTPKALMCLFAPNGSPLDTNNNQARLSVGFYDGTTHRAFGVTAEHNDAAATAFCGGRTDIDTLIQVPQNPNSMLQYEARVVSVGTDQVVLEWSENAGNGHGYFVSFSGDALSAKCGSSTSSASIGGTVAVTGVGFKPDAIIIATCGQAFAANSPFTELACSVGFAGRLPSITQCCSSFCAENLQANTSVGNISRDDAAGTVLLSAAGTVSESTRLEVSSFDTDGFTVTTRNAAVAVQFMWLALRLAERHVKCAAPSVDVTALGAEAVTGTGFKPEILFASSLVNAAVNSLGSTQGHLCVSAATSASAVAAAALNARDNLATSDTHNASSSTSLIHMPQTSGASDYIAALTSFDDDGFTLNITDVALAARPIPYMAIEDRKIIGTSDTEQVSDSAVIFLNAFLPTSDTEELADSAVLIVHKIITSETEEISDTPVLVTGTAGDLLIVVSETEEISDIFNIAGGFVSVFSETEQISDSAAPLLGNLIVVGTETEQISDEFARSDLIHQLSDERGSSFQGGAEAGASFDAHAERGFA